MLMITRKGSLYHQAYDKLHAPDRKGFIENQTSR